MENDPSMQYYIEHCSSSICFLMVRNLTYIEHIHRSFELIYVLEGQVETEISGQRTSLREGDLLFIADGYIHSYASSPNSRTVVAAVNPEEVPQFTEFLRTCPVSFCLVKDAKHTGLIDFCFHSLTDTDPDSINQIAAAGYIDLILSHLVPLIQRNAPLQPAQPTILKNALKYIYEHIPTPASSDDVAAHAGVSYYHLSRLFNRSIGINLSTYCSLINILMARRMLVQTALPINEIRQRCGYANLRSFDRDFTRFSGMSPREYRAKNQSGGQVDYDIPFVREMLLDRWNMTL